MSGCCTAATGPYDITYAIGELLAGKLLMFDARCKYWICCNKPIIHPTIYCKSHQTHHTHIFSDLLANSSSGFKLLTSLQPDDYQEQYPIVANDMRAVQKAISERVLRMRLFKYSIRPGGFAKLYAAVTLNQPEPASAPDHEHEHEEKGPDIDDPPIHVAAAPAQIQIIRPPAAPVGRKPRQPPKTLQSAPIITNFMTLGSSAPAPAPAAAAAAPGPAATVFHRVHLNATDDNHQLDPSQTYDCYDICAKNSRRLGIICQDNIYYVVIYDSLLNAHKAVIGGTVIGTLCDTLSEKAPIIHHNAHCYVRSLKPYIFEGESYYPCMISHQLFTDETYVGKVVFNVTKTAIMSVQKQTLGLQFDVRS